MTDLNTGRGELRRIDDQAAAWAAKQLSGVFSKVDEAELGAWLDADPRHSIALAEYMEIAEASALAGAAGGKRRHANDEPALDAQPQRRWLQYGVPAIAASLFAAFFVFAVFQSPPSKGERFATALGETREVSLPDGTMATLNTNTVLTYAFVDGERQAKIEQGEVFFDVAHDASQPFIVDAGDARATVLGTSFTVHKETSRSVVSVMSGVVAVTPATKSLRMKSLRLEAGQTVSVNASGAFSTINDFDENVAATWRHGYLFFDQTPLEHVVSDLNRYFIPKIELGNADLGSTPVSGRVELDDQDVAIRAISVALSLEADRTETDKIVLRANE